MEHENSNNNETAAFGNTLLCEVAYEKCQLVAKYVGTDY